MTNEEHRSGGMGMRTREMEMRNGTWGMGVEEQEAGKLDEGTWRMDEERRIWNEEVGTRNMKLRNEGRSYNERRVKKNYGREVVRERKVTRNMKGAGNEARE